MKKFPNLLHIGIETPHHDEPYFAVYEGGVFDCEQHGQPIAIYKLVQAGTVRITKDFVKSSRR
jgi:hypothetical protein